MNRNDGARPDLAEAMQFMREHSSIKEHVMRSILVVCLLLLIASTFVQVKTVSAGAKSGRSIDVFTDRGGRGTNQSSDMFGPQETVRLYADVIADGRPQMGVLVTFEILEPESVSNRSAFYRTAETNASGEAQTEFLLPTDEQNGFFGIWTVDATAEVYSEILTDFLTFRMYWTVELLSVRTVDENPPNITGFPPDRHLFGEAGLIGIEVALRNNMMALRNASIAISVADELGTTVNSTFIQDLILPPFGRIIYIFKTLELPKYTAPGNATVIVDALDNQKVSLSPQISANVDITIYNPVFPTFEDDAVVYAGVYATVVKPGDNFEAIVIMRNEGTVQLDNISVNAYVNNTLITSQIIQTLDPYAYQFFNVTWKTSGLPEGNYTLVVNATVFPEEADLTDNSYAVSFEVKAPTIFLYDVAVVSVQPQSQEILVGEILTILVTVANKGTMMESFNVTLYFDSFAIQTVTVYSLPPANNQTLTFYWNTANLPAGDYTMSAYAEPVAGETNLENNLFTDGQVRLLLPPNGFVHDVAIINVTASPSTAYVGDDIEIMVEAANFGNYTETFNITAFYDNSTIFGRQVISLTPGQTTTIESKWRTSNVTADTYHIRALAETVFGEVNTENNAFTDGQVTLFSRSSLQNVMLIYMFIFIYILVIVASLVLVLFLAFLRRRRKRRSSRRSYFVVVHPHV